MLIGSPERPLSQRSGSISIDQIPPRAAQCRCFDENAWPEKPLELKSETLFAAVIIPVAKGNDDSHSYSSELVKSNRVL